MSKILYKILFLSCLCFTASCIKSPTNKTSKVAPEPLSFQEELPPLALRTFSFIEAPCFYRDVASANIVQTYACMDKKSFENFLIDLELIKTRNYQLNQRLKIYNEYYSNKK